MTANTWVVGDEGLLLRHLGAAWRWLLPPAVQTAVWWPWVWCCCSFYAAAMIELTPRPPLLITSLLHIHVYWAVNESPAIESRDVTSVCAAAAPHASEPFILNERVWAWKKINSFTARSEEQSNKQTRKSTLANRTRP